MEGLEVHHSRVGARRDISLLRIRGYLDTQTCGIMRTKMYEVLNEGFLHLIIDMGFVNYVSSAGWGVFVGEIKNIRERGGDLKIVQMLPEVYDVFEMLEFNRILESYDTIEEAIDDFDLSIGLDITKSITRTIKRETNGAAQPANQPQVETIERPQIQNRTASRSQQKNEKRDPKFLPLSEKIRYMIIENPNRSAWRIYKDLKMPEFGGTKVSFFQVYKLMRKMSLTSKEERYRFYRSR